MSLKNTIRKKYKTMPMKKIFYTYFLLLIVIPILFVLCMVLLFINHRFKEQKIENIKQAQETIITELNTDIKNSSIRLSHMLYVNDNDIINKAAGTNVADRDSRYLAERELNKAINILVEPIKETASVAFYMKSDNATFFRNDIHIPIQETKEEKWYKTALNNTNHVIVGSYNIDEKNELIQNGERNSLILVFAVSPGSFVDRSGNVEMVCVYQISGAAKRIREYNRKYIAGENQTGITRIIDGDGEVVFDDMNSVDARIGHTKVSSEIAVNNESWKIESYISDKGLYGMLLQSALISLGAAMLILLMAGYFARFFLKDIIRPIDSMKDGMKQVEDGNLDVYINAEGTHEVRMMTHQFNAMVKRLKSLIGEYEERVAAVTIDDDILFERLINGSFTIEQVILRNKTFFADGYGLFTITYNIEKEQLMKLLELNPRFTSRCMAASKSPGYLICMYRIGDEEFPGKALAMIKDLQHMAKQRHDKSLEFCIGESCESMGDFIIALDEVTKYMEVQALMGEEAIINLCECKDYWSDILGKALKYEKLAQAICVDDERNFLLEKEKVFSEFDHFDMEYNRHIVYSVLLAINRQFVIHGSDGKEVFGERYNYEEKLSHIETERNLKLWLTNYWAWIMDYAATQLNLMETDVVTKARRYISNHYENPNLKLGEVADYVGLNEKYFTNRFTKEGGETFTSYLAGIRLEKAKDLLNNTDYKIYEIAEMSGYQSSEHFTRMFKKYYNISPTQYRKNKKISE